MKALMYTLVLTAVLVGAVIWFRSLEPEPQGRTSESSDGEVDRPDSTWREPPAPRSTMEIKSKPAARSDIGQGDLGTDNLGALYVTGVELLDLWHVPEAIDIFENILRTDSSRTDACLRLVECYSHPTMGREKEAAALWRYAMSLAKASGKDLLWVEAMGDVFVRLAPVAAIDRITRVMDGEDADDDAPYFLALALLIDGRAEDAVPHLEGLLRKDQGLGRVRELLIYCEAARGHYEAAEMLARELAAVYPKEPYPYVLLSRVLLVQGKVKDAVEFSNNALRLDNRYVPAIVARAHLYVAESHYQAARVSFEKLQLFDDAMLSSVATEGLAYVDFLTGRFDDASEEMHEAIRLAMSVGSERRGLSHAFRLVDYLCELGRLDAAGAVVDRWISRRGEIPKMLGSLRISIARGDPARTRRALTEIRGKRAWRAWMRQLGLDYADIEAATFLREDDFVGALRVLDAADEHGVPGTRQPYLKGFALFQSGKAEEAAHFFEQARFRIHSTVFPYHGDPILHAQSLFFLAEAALARGESDEALSHYQGFLDLWGQADWELEAVQRTKEKLQTLSLTPPSG